MLFGLERLHSEHRCSALSVCSALNRTNYLGQCEAGEKRPPPFLWLSDLLKTSRAKDSKQRKKGSKVEAIYLPLLLPSPTVQVGQWSWRWDQVNSAVHNYQNQISRHHLHHFHSQALTQKLIHLQIYTFLPLQLSLPKALLIFHSWLGRGIANLQPSTPPHLDELSSPITTNTCRFQHIIWL